METKKISIDVLTKTMSPKEMQNVLGGSEPGNVPCCLWCCTVSAHGDCDKTRDGSGYSFDNCENQALNECPLPDGYKIQMVGSC